MQVATYFAPLWRFLDVAFDMGARQPLNLDVADIYMAVEDFCHHAYVPDQLIPSHHRYMFQLRKDGFMQQAKYPWYSSKDWIREHPTPLAAELQVDTESVLYKLQEFVKAEDKYHCVLDELHRGWVSCGYKFA